MKPPPSLFPFSATISLPPLTPREPGRLPHELPRDRHSGHDVHLDGLPAAQEPDLLDGAEAEAAVEVQVEDVAAFEVAGAVLDVGLVSPLVNDRIPSLSFFPKKKPDGKENIAYVSGLGLDWTYLLGGVLDQTLGVPFAPGPRFRADVDEVPGVFVVVA